MPARELDLHRRLRDSHVPDPSSFEPPCPLDDGLVGSLRLRKAIPTETEAN